MVSGAHTIVFLWSSYDAEADALYICFKKPAHATDSELTNDDVIVRYEDGEVMGLTVLHGQGCDHRRAAGRQDHRPAFGARPRSCAASVSPGFRDLVAMNVRLVLADLTFVRISDLVRTVLSGQRVSAPYWPSGVT